MLWHLAYNTVEKTFTLLQILHIIFFQSSREEPIWSVANPCDKYRDNIERYYWRYKGCNKPPKELSMGRFIKLQTDFLLDITQDICKWHMFLWRWPAARSSTGAALLYNVQVTITFIIKACHTSFGEMHVILHQFILDHVQYIHSLSVFH